MSPSELVTLQMYAQSSNHAIFLLFFSINLRFARKKACANGYYFDILETKKAIYN